MRQSLNVFRSISLLLLLVVGSAVAVLGACTGTGQAYRNAETLDAQAYVMAEHFNALQLAAIELAEEGGASQDVINRVAAAERKARPVILQLNGVAQTYQAARTAETEAELEQALNSAALALSDFLNALRGRP